MQTKFLALKKSVLVTTTRSTTRLIIGMKCVKIIMNIYESFSVLKVEF